MGFAGIRPTAWLWPHMGPYPGRLDLTQDRDSSPLCPIKCFLISLNGMGIGNVWNIGWPILLVFLKKKSGIAPIFQFFRDLWTSIPR